MSKRLGKMQHRKLKADGIWKWCEKKGTWHLFCPAAFYRTDLWPVSDPMPANQYPSTCIPVSCALRYQGRGGDEKFFEDLHSNPAALCENGTNDTIRVFTRLRSSGCARTKLFCTSTHRLIYKEDSIYRAVWCQMQQVSKAWVSGPSVPPRHFQCLVKYAKHIINSLVVFPSITSSFQNWEATKHWF